MEYMGLNAEHCSDGREDVRIGSIREVRGWEVGSRPRGMLGPVFAIRDTDSARRRPVWVGREVVLQKCCAKEAVQL